MVSVRTLMDEFVSLERAAGLFEFQSNGVSVWWFVRQRVIFNLLGRLTGIDPLKKTADSLGASSAIRMAFRSLPYLVRQGSRPASIVALSTSSARRHRTEDGHAFDVVCDFLRFVPGTEYAVLELPDRAPHALRPFSNEVVYGDRISLSGNIGRMLFSKRECRGAMRELRDGIVDLSRKLGVELPAHQVGRLVSREVGFVTCSMPTVETLLNRLKPKVMFVECGYAPSHMVIQLLAKKRGIPVLELQHGLITRDHPGYFFGLPRQYHLGDSPFPDGLLVFGEHFRRILTGNPSLCPDSIIPVGYPYLQIEYTKRQLSLRSDRPNGVLITSQPGLGEFWADFAVMLARKTRAPVVIKPHPAESGTVGSVFRRALESGIVDVIRDNRSLFDLFPLVSSHLSVASTSHLEAIAFGLQDVIVPAHGLERHFEFLRDLGLPLAKSPEEVASILEHYPDIEPIRKYVRDDVFALHRDSFAAVRDVINKYR